MTVSTTWLTWISTSLILLLSTRNPIYILIALTTLLFLGAHISHRKEQPNWIGQNLRFLIIMITISTLINVIFAHTGRTILFALPKNWPVIGGNMTLESLVYGAVNGLVIGSLYLLFNILNLVLSIKQITRLIPNAFRPISIMITISLTFFPSIQRRTREIREAQIIRGNRMKKVSDWVPIIIPLLVTSLENAILLSESMTARGFNSKSSMKFSNLNLVTMIFAVFAVFAGWILRLYDYPIVISAILYVLGISSITLILLIAGKHVNVSHFHQEIWHPRDIIFVVMSFFIAVAMIGLQPVECLPSFLYSPYPILSFPEISVLGIILSAMPGLPLVFMKFD
ncbi:MAG: energy-coupling factor transporter transmembrane component T [Chloroflexota bacterium]|nr:energy-coupling factor transporter transmembrane component T [Chloroflexota bacterium]